MIVRQRRSCLAITLKATTLEKGFKERISAHPEAGGQSNALKRMDYSLQYWPRRRQQSAARAVVLYPENEAEMHKYIVTHCQKSIIHCSFVVGQNRMSSVLLMYTKHEAFSLARATRRRRRKRKRNRSKHVVLQGSSIFFFFFSSTRAYQHAA